jgi:hypothetical protein
MEHRHKPLDIIDTETYPISEFTYEELVWQASVLLPQDRPLSGVAEELTAWK